MPQDIYGAYKQANDRGMERINQVAEKTIKEFESLIKELETECERLQAGWHGNEVKQVKETLEKIKSNQERVGHQRERLLEKMDVRWKKSTNKGLSARGLTKLKAGHQKEFVGFKQSVIKDIERVGKVIVPTLESISKEGNAGSLERNLAIAELVTNKNVARVLSNRESRFFSIVREVIKFPNSATISVSTITPANELEGELVPSIDKTPMEDSSQRANSENIVNFHVSSFARKGRQILSNFNRTGVLSVDKKIFGKETHEVNKNKVRQLFQLELSQQLNRSERFEQLEQIRSLVSEGKYLGVQDGVPVLDIDTVEIDHFTLSLVTMAGVEKEMFLDEQKAMESFQNQVEYYELMIDGKRVKVPAKFNIHMMNTGVAEISTRRLKTDGFNLRALLGSLIDKITGMSKFQKKLNSATWEKMSKGYPKYTDSCQKSIEALKNKIAVSKDPLEIEELKEKLEKLEQDFKKATLLFDQISEAGGPENYDKISGNPYAIPARILLLADLMGMSVHFHCKSGKDRTGMMDIEMKYIAQMMDRSLDKGIEKIEVPPIHLNEETEEHIQTRNRIALKSGNTKIAFINTGEYGLKTTRRKENIMRYGEIVAGILSGESDISSS